MLCVCGDHTRVLYIPTVVTIRVTVTVCSDDVGVIPSSSVVNHDLQLIETEGRTMMTKEHATRAHTVLPLMHKHDLIVTL